MRRMIYVLMVLWGSCLCVGQRVPQWKVVQAVTLMHQKAEVGATTLFTPTAPGLYRLSGYLSLEGSGNATWFVDFQWYDLNGTPVGSYFAATFGQGGNWAEFAPVTFSMEPGHSFIYQTVSSGTETGVYNLGFTVEQLE